MVIKKRFCMLCENREDDPSIDIEFVLKCPGCGYWLCEDCRDQLTEVGKYSCLNCKEKLIPKIVTFEPVVPPLPENDVIFKGDPPGLVKLTSEIHKDVPLRATIESSTVFKDVPIRLSTYDGVKVITPGELVIPSTKEPGLVERFVDKIKGQNRKMSPIEKLRAGKLDEKMPSRTYGSYDNEKTNKELLEYLMKAAYTTREIADWLKIKHVSVMSRLLRLESKGLVARKYHPKTKTQYWFNAKLLEDLKGLPNE